MFMKALVLHTKKREKNMQRDYGQVKMQIVDVRGNGALMDLPSI